MNDPRVLLVIVGLVCQGFSWDEYHLSWAYGGLGIAAAWFGRGRSLTNQTMDGVALLIGCIIGSALSKALGQSSHFFLGHGLALVQISRMLRPLSRRDQMFTILIAFFHLGVGASILLDYRFILVFALTFWLAPKALMRFEAEGFDGEAAPAVRLRLPLAASFATLLIAIAFFFFFPRVFLGPGGAPIGGGDQPSLLDSILDPSKGGLAQSDRTLLQMEGENIGYLRLHVLSGFDGLKWTADRLGSLRRISFVSDAEAPKFPLRKVRVKQSAYLGRMLPTDGRLVHLKGNFFRGAAVNLFGIIETSTMWNTANNYYEYRINPRPEPQELNTATRNYFLQHPAQSDRLQAWVRERTAGATNAAQKALALEANLATNFTYRIGAPDLNRLNFADDFIFNQKEGHCERFAATLALLLRMEGIPSRVAVGYVPTVRNPFTGWYNVRFKDAHAWTEAYIDGRGWVTLDATPAGEGGSPGGWSFRDLVDTLDTAWYAHFVNFDSGMQRNMLTTASDAIGFAFRTSFNHAGKLLTGLGLLIAMIGARRWWRERARGLANRRKPQSRVFAENHYGQMLRALARLGFERHPEQTPAEFASAVRTQRFEATREVERVTEAFCATRYGEHELTESDRAEARSALERIQSLKR